MKEKFDKLMFRLFTHWQWYKGFFNITVLRYLVTWFALVPIVLKLIESFNPSLKVKDIVEIHFFSNASLPFNLQILWISSLLFVIALFLYQFFCPTFIKTYSSYTDYLKFGHSPRWIIWESEKVINDPDEVNKLFERLSTKEYVKQIEKHVPKTEVKVEKDQTVIYFQYNNENYSMGLPILTGNNQEDLDKTKIAEREIFWEIFGRFSSSKKLVRFLILVLLLFSAALFAWTLIEHIWSGLQYIKF